MMQPEQSCWTPWRLCIANPKECRLPLESHEHASLWLHSWGPPGCPRCPLTDSLLKWRVGDHTPREPRGPLLCILPHFSLVFPPAQCLTQHTPAMFDSLRATTQMSWNESRQLTRYMENIYNSLNLQQNPQARIWGHPFVVTAST